MAENKTTAVQALPKKTLMSRKNSEKFVDFLLVLPALALLAIFTYYPVAKLLQISFTDWNLLKPTWNYVGLKNWNWLLLTAYSSWNWYPPLSRKTASFSAARWHLVILMLPAAAA